jgi:hypothetical protein
LLKHSRNIVNQDLAAERLPFRNGSFWLMKKPAALASFKIRLAEAVGLIVNLIHSFFKVRT